MAKLPGAALGALLTSGWTMFGMKRALAVVTIGLLLSLPTLNAAQAAPAGVTRQEVVAWLTGEGHAANLHDDSSGTSIVSSSIDGVNFDVYFYACTGERCTSIQFAAGWTPLAKATPDTVNAWNRDKRFLKAYLDKSNNLWGEYDFDLTDAPYPQLHDALARFDSQVVDFKANFGG